MRYAIIAHLHEVHAEQLGRHEAAGVPANFLIAGQQSSLLLGGQAGQHRVDVLGTAEGVTIQSGNGLAQALPWHAACANTG